MSTSFLNIARNNKLGATVVGIELAESQGEKHSRSSLLYFWTVCTIRGLQQGKHLVFDLADLVACVFLFTEMSFAYRVRVTVLDDSNSASEVIEALKSQFGNLFYSARKHIDRSWHKAGNINHGLKFVAYLPGGPSELVAGLDVDMIPNKEWLRRLVPQHGTRLLLDQIQLVPNTRRDFVGEGLGTGTGWMASRVALDANNGFAVDGFAEGYLTSVDIQAAGWTVALLDGDLQ
ncbi:MAG: hypothetical protein Q9221_007011 [Calogaya cf. arnoldii]